jgi:PAS domain S-box-containing protein
MSQGNDVWQAVTAELFGQLYARLWLRLEQLLGSATTMDIIALSTETLQDAYPFLSRLTWRSQGLVLATLRQAIADEEDSHVQAGCERLLQEVYVLLETCYGQALASRLQAEIEQLRQSGDPAVSPSTMGSREDAATPLAETPEQALQILQSLGQQVLKLYRRHRDTQSALEQVQSELDAWRQTASSVAIASAAAPSTPTDLARSETFYHDLFELSPDGVIVTDTKGDILQVNARCAEILELDSPAELIGRSVSQFLVYPEQRDAFLERISQSDRVEGQRRELRTHRGRRIIILFSSRLIQYEGKSCLLSVVRDVTERARLAQEMEDFAYSASHDLQAPLRTFEGYARWLLEDYGDGLDEMGRQLCEEIIDDALHMKKLLDGLLEYSRIGRLHTRAVAVDVAVVLERVLHDLQIEIFDTHACITVPQTLPTVFYPEVRLTQIFANLLSNALKFTVPGRAPEIGVDYEVLPRHYRFSVRDNGIGIAPEHTERIFEIFKRLHTREEYPGTGAGLTIVKKIVESHGGQIGLSSTPGQGSTFWFTIPKREDAP